jgi:ATP-dependent DNA ligase
VAVFDALHRRGRVRDAILQAFDLLELDGVDYRPLPLGNRKDRLAQPLARVQVGIAINEHADATRMAPWCSHKPAEWVWRGSCRNE